MKKYLLGALLPLLLPLSALASIDTDLRYGSRGPEVNELQEFLIDKGFLGGSASGNFFSLTRTAAKKYQASVGLPPSGFVGRLTRAKINSELQVQESEEVTAAPNAKTQDDLEKQLADLKKQLEQLSKNKQGSKTEPQSLQESTSRDSGGSAVPATPATPAMPATPSQGTTTSAIPATPAVPATPATPASTTPPSQTQTKIFGDNFDSYSDGSIIGQGGWVSYANGSNFSVKTNGAQSGSKSLFVNTPADSVVAKAGNLLSDGKMSIYVKTFDRAKWATSTDGNAQVRISKGPWAAGTAIFTAVSFKKDGNVAAWDGSSYSNFATYNDNEWTHLEIEWRSSDKTAIFRVNNGEWLARKGIQGAANFMGFDHIGFDFDARGGSSDSGGVYFDTVE